MIQTIPYQLVPREDGIGLSLSLTLALVVQITVGIMVKLNNIRWFKKHQLINFQNI